MNKYNWQYAQWPNFQYQVTQKVEELIYAYIKETSFLSGEFLHLTENYKNESLIDIMVSEAVKSSAIEGEHFDVADVRSSIRNQLGLSEKKEAIKDPRSKSLAKLMILVRQKFQEPLTVPMLFQWQDLLITDIYERRQISVGRWRTNKEPMQIVSGALGHETVHFEAPPSNQVPKEMDRFILWFNQSHALRGPIRAAIAHLYFESIHPFDDGNGRVGRALCEKVLSQELGRPVLLSISKVLYRRKKQYYQELEKASHTLEITSWIEFFVEVIYEAQLEAKESIHFVFKKAQFFERYGALLNERQLKVIKRMFEEGAEGFEGGMSQKKYVNIAQCSTSSATRDLTELVALGCFVKLERGGRSTRYDLSL